MSVKAPAVTVRAGDPRSPEGRALLAASHAYLASLYPPEHNHFLDVDALAAPRIAFMIAEADGRALGCAALARMDGYAEIKSMYVDPAARGAGVGAALMDALEALARREGIAWLRLETGDTLLAAQRLYARHGFAPTAPFGGYAEGPHSVFMERRLA